MVCAARRFLEQLSTAPGSKGMKHECHQLLRPSTGSRLAAEDDQELLFILPNSLHTGDLFLELQV